MKTAEALDNLATGYSVQGARVLNSHGELWHEFASHELAVAAVEAFTKGFSRGREIGHREGRQALQGELRRLINSPRELAD